MLLCLAFAAHAGEAAQEAAGAPASDRSAMRPATDAPSARSNVPAYRSALERYRPYRADEALKDWREVNDEVGRLGGHMGHMRPRDEAGGRR